MDKAVTQAIRAGGMEAGFDAYRASTFIPNPHEPGSPAFEAWADGYDLGVLQARDVLVAANDDDGPAYLDRVGFWYLPSTKIGVDMVANS